MKKIIKAGSTDQTIDLWIGNSASTVGAGLTGLSNASAGLICFYRKGALGNATQLTLANQTAFGAHTDGGFAEISAANMSGLYRLDLSDTIVATTGSASLTLQGATNMAPVAIELQLVTNDFEAGVVASVTGGVGGNVTGTVGGVIGNMTGNITGNITGNLSGSVGLVLGDVGGNVAGSVGEVLGDVGGNLAGSVGLVLALDDDTITDLSIAANATAEINTVLSASHGNGSWEGGGAAPTVAEIADGVWDEATANHTSAGTFGKQLKTELDLTQSYVIANQQMLAPLTIVYNKTAQNSGADFLQLEAAAEATDDFYNDGLLIIMSGNGTGQFRPILDYYGANTTAIVAAWDVTPATTAGYAILPFGFAASVGGDATEANQLTILSNLGNLTNTIGVDGGNLTAIPQVGEVTGNVAGSVGNVLGDVGGNLSGSAALVLALANNSITSDTLHSSASTEIATAANLTLSAAHGNGSWEGAGGGDATEANQLTLISNLANLTNTVGVAGANLTAIPQIGNVTGDVLGNVAGSVASAITLGANATTAIDNALSSAHGNGAWDGNHTVPTANETAAAVWAAAISGNSTAGTKGGELSSASAGGDPWSTVVPGAYANGTAGAALGRLNNTAPAAPVIVIPDAPSDLTLCGVFGYLRTPLGTPAIHAEVTATLVVPGNAAVGNETIISGRTVRTHANTTGFAYMELIRTDEITLANCTYSISCPSAAIDSANITLTSTTFDLATLLP